MINQDYIHVTKYRDFTDSTLLLKPASGHVLISRKNEREDRD